MEQDNIQTILQFAGIEVDAKTLQNPTEEFMLYLVMEYLKLFRIDGNKIAKPTPEQLDLVSSEESALKAIKAMNLYAALARIGEEIFLKDLSLTDFTSPGYKKICKRIRVLNNFLLYVKNKKAENEHFFNALDDRQREMMRMAEKKSELIAEIGAVINDRENKLEYKERAEAEKERLIEEMKEGEIEVRALNEECERLAKLHQEKLRHLNAVKTKAHELHKINTDLQSKIVRSPEEYVAKCKELKATLEEKMEERQTINDGITRKKSQIKKNENAEALVKSCQVKFADLGRTIKSIKETTAQLDLLKSQVKELKAEIGSLERNLNSSRDDEATTTSMTIDCGKTEKLLRELENTLMDKRNEHCALEKKLEKLHAERSRMKSELKKIRELISATETDYSLMMDNFKGNFNAELSEELDFRKNLDQLLSSNF